MEPLHLKVHQLPPRVNLRGRGSLEKNTRDSNMDSKILVLLKSFKKFEPGLGSFLEVRAISN